MSTSDIFRKASDLSDRGTAYVLVTVIRTEGSTPSVAGGRLILTSGGETAGTIGGGTLEKLALKEAGIILEKEGSLVKNYVLDGNEVSPDSERTGMLCGGEVTLFFEHIGAAEKVIIFGAGHIGKVLFKFLSELNFRISVLDDREAQDDALNNMKVIYYNGMEEAMDKAGNLENSYIVIASHSHELDYQILLSIIRSGIKPLYTGVVASRKKIEKMLSDLKVELGGIPETSSIYSPAGIDIGGRSPSEIALSIAAEIQAVRYKKKNFKHLSEVPGTIK